MQPILFDRAALIPVRKRGNACIRIALAATTTLALACSDSWSPARNPGTILIISGDGQVGTVGTPLARDLVVQVFAQDSLPLGGFRVDFRTTAGSARTDPVSVESDSMGRASTRVTPTGPGNIQVVAAVYSSGLSVPFLLAADQQGAPSPCGTAALRLAPAQIVTDVGGPGICLAGASAGSDYVLTAFNSGTARGDSTTLLVMATGNAAPSATAGAAPVAKPSGARATAADRRTIASRGGAAVRASHTHSSPPALQTLIPLARAWSRAQDLARAGAAERVGDVLALNARLDESCTKPELRGARVVAVTRTAVVAADTTSPANGFTDEDYRSIGLAFDTLWNPVDTLSFKPPFDIDANRSVVLFITPAVNRLPPDGNGQRLAVFQRRDLFPRTSASGGPLCPSSNAAELIYLAVPDPAGAYGSARTKSDIMQDLGRQVVHEYQHLINASRRIYVNGAPDFEEAWLDEALSQATEELLFQQMAPRPSRQNLGANDLSATPQTLDAFLTVQRPNIEHYRRFLGVTEGFSPLAPDSPATRGAAWSMLRYLVDRRAYLDYVSFSDLLNSSVAGFDNLIAVFGPSLRHQLRDWSVSLLTDDLFATGSLYQQPSWNFQSIFAALGEPTTVAVRGVPAGGADTVTIAQLGSVYFRVSVPPNGTAAVSWSGPGGGTVSPYLQWTIVRTR